MTDYNPIVLNMLSPTDKKILMEGTLEEREKVIERYHENNGWVKVEYLGEDKFKPILSSTDGYLQAVPLYLYTFPCTNGELFEDRYDWEMKVFAESKAEALMLLQHTLEHEDEANNLNDLLAHPEYLKEYPIKKGVIE